MISETTDLFTPRVNVKKGVADGNDIEKFYARKNSSCR